VSGFLKLYVLLAVLTGGSALPQELLNPPDAENANRAFQTLSGQHTLKCKITAFRPMLDFAFRFDAGYVVDCPLSQLDGKETDLVTYTRVTPRGGAPVVLGEVFRVPAPPADLARIDPRHLRTVLEISGGFALGEGEYTVEVLVSDRLNRSCHKRWEIKARRNRGQRKVTVAMEAGTVSHIWPDPWEGKFREKGSGLRITVLLHAAPMNPRAASLRVWDRTFLLEALSSLLRHIPCESVRVVAFNLDQQREVYREDQFDGPALGKLAHRLRNLELGTVDYRALSRDPATNALLASLANEQLAAAHPSDAVIFLGPTTRTAQKTPLQVLKNGEPGQPRFYYFEYFPWAGADFADSIEYLTSALHGKTFHVHSPGEFGKSLQKLLEELTPDQRSRGQGFDAAGAPGEK
jgi:hypothetical protein